MRPTTGFPELDGALFVEGEPLIVYGEPAVGKTNLLLKILKESLKRGASAAYISTEGSIVAERMEQVGVLDFPELYIGFANSLTHLALLVFEALASSYSIVAIDSVNSLYRSSVGSIKRANEIFLGVLAALKAISRSGRWAIATAQVREAGDDVEPSGIDLIRFYCSNMARIYRAGRRRIIEARNKRYYLKILDRDIEVTAYP